MRENELTAKIDTWIKSLGVFHFKVHGAGFQAVGLPDFLICWRGIFVGLELKILPRKITDIQNIVRGSIENHGGCYILCSLDEETQKLKWEWTHGAMERSFGREQFRDQLTRICNDHIRKRTISGFKSVGHKEL